MSFRRPKRDHRPRFLSEAVSRLFPGLLTVLLALVLIQGMAGPAWAEGIPLELEMSIFLRIISYDRSLPASGHPFHVVLVTGRAVEDGSLRELEKRIQSFFGAKTLMGRPVTVSCFRSDDLAALETASAPHLLILHEIPDPEAGSTIRFARKRRIMVFSDSPTQIESGATVVVAVENGQPVIQVDLAAARKVGADFHANFLKHCRVIK